MNWWVRIRKDIFILLLEHFHILVSTVTRRVCISVFVSLVGIPIEIMSLVMRLESCAKAVQIKKYKATFLKKKKS